MDRSNDFLYFVAIVMIIVLVVFSSFIEFDGFNWDNLVMIPVILGLFHFLRTVIYEIIHNKVNNKMHIVQQKYRLYTLLKKNDSRLDEIESYIIQHEDINDAKRIRSILLKNNIKIDSIKQIQESIENGEIENIICQITDKQSSKDLKNILKTYGTEVGFVKLRIMYETKSLLNTEKSFELTSGALSILSILLGFYMIQDIWDLICANWINFLFVAICLIIDTILTYSTKNEKTYEYYSQRYNEVKYYIDMMDNEQLH